MDLVRFSGSELFKIEVLSKKICHLLHPLVSSNRHLNSIHVKVFMSMNIIF